MTHGVLYCTVRKTRQARRLRPEAVEGPTEVFPGWDETLALQFVIPLFAWLWPDRVIKLAMARKILCVAEKPAIARAVATHMSGGSFQTVSCPNINSEVSIS